MKITESKARHDALLQRIAEREFGARTGTHQSDLVYCLNRQALRKLKPKPPTDSEVLTFMRGHASQAWLTGKFNDQPPVTVDGITVTLDAVWYEDDLPWELKSTFQSSNRPVAENVHWLRQLMAECYVQGTHKIVLSRVEDMGNWSWIYRPKKPEKIAELVERYGPNWDEHPTVHVYEIEFDDAELKANWAWLQRRKVLYEAVLKTGVLLPKALALPSVSNQDDPEDWECKTCGYQKECEEAANG